jgi:hypothetical protein
VDDTSIARRPDGRSVLLPLAFVLGPVVVLLLVVAIGGSRAEHLIVEVPLGTAAQLAAGETVELLPRTVELKVGDSMEIRNHDVEAHEVGPYIVPAGQTLVQSFPSPGVLQGACTLHPDGEVAIVVR